MRPIQFFLTIVLLAPTCLAAQSNAPIFRYYTAKSYDRYQGLTRIAKVQELQNQDWIVTDTMYSSQDASKYRTFELQKTDLAPFVDNDGYIVYWVPEVAPQLPGGKAALDQFVDDVLHPFIQIITNADKVRHNSVYVRCTITGEGQIMDVAEAQGRDPNVPAELVEQCLDAVRYMPAWTPGLFHGKPVRTIRLIIF